MSDDAGFFGRWARRKTLARAGAPLPQAPESTDRLVPQAESASGRSEGATTVAAAQPLAGATTQRAADPASIANGGGVVAEPDAQVPAPTLADVDPLTPASDFSRFVARDVAPAVRNAAVKKLFTDPHFNVMDGLDIYIDDYSLSDPLPEALTRKMVSADVLGLFNEPVGKASADANAVAAQLRRMHWKRPVLPHPLARRPVTPR